VGIRLVFAIFLAISLLGAAAWSACTGGDPSPSAPDAVSGLVVDGDGPVAGATVRVQGTGLAVTTDAEGRFRLAGLTPRKPVAVTAWAPGYYIVGGEEFLPGTDNVDLELVAHDSHDNPDYEWISAFASAGLDANCQNCHSDPDDPTSALPFDEWARDAHGGSAQNPRFLTMYTGTDVQGNQSPPTRYGYNRDYGRFPLRPDPNRPYYGPGYELDFPGTAGNCAACHAPAASVNDPYGVDPTDLTGVGAEGVACDFCHKVWDVRLDPETGLPYANMPGVLSFEFRRPPEGHQFFAGPLDDVAPGEDTYSPLQTESQFCASCHFGAFWDTVVYNSFGEWLESPYSDPTFEGAQTCQGCHMPSGLTDHFALIDEGGLERDPSTIFSHRMLGAGDEELLKNAASLAVKANVEGDRLVVEVSVTNDRTGHHLPTDSPLRNVLLVVSATDANGSPLALLEGPTLPSWAADDAGKPGRGYAKILEELWTQISPTGAYWNPTRVLEDTRIAALATDTSTYTFAAPDEGDATAAVTLIFRRAFSSLADQKRWDVPDIVMEEAAVVAGP
jgi:hypothetical protein